MIRRFSKYNIISALWIGKDHEQSIYCINAISSSATFWSLPKVKVLSFLWKGIWNIQYLVVSLVNAYTKACTKVAVFKVFVVVVFYLKGWRDVTVKKSIVSHLNQKTKFLNCFPYYLDLLLGSGTFYFFIHSYTKIILFVCPKWLSLNYGRLFYLRDVIFYVKSEPPWISLFANFMGTLYILYLRFNLSLFMNSFLFCIYNFP